MANRLLFAKQLVVMTRDDFGLATLDFSAILGDETIDSVQVEETVGSGLTLGTPEVTTEEVTVKDDKGKDVVIAIGQGVQLTLGADQASLGEHTLRFVITFGVNEVRSVDCELEVNL